MLTMDNQSTFATPNTRHDEDYTFLSILTSRSRATYYFTITAVLFVVWLLRTNNRGKIDAPFYKASLTKWLFDAETLIRDSYVKFQDEVYQIKATEGIQTLIPVKLIGEIKGLPDNVLSQPDAVAEAMQTRYTKFSPGHNSEMLALLVRTRLTQNLARLIPLLKGELEYIVATEFPACEDWTSVKFQPFSLRAISRLSGRAFVGSAISRTEEWMKTSIEYAVTVFMACVKLQFFPEWARPMAQYFVSDLYKLRREVNKVKSMLKPVLEERVQLRKLGVPADERPDDMTEWLLDGLPDEEKEDVQVHAELQLILAAASIHTTNNLVCECILDLAAHPEAQEELRREAYQILEVEGGWAHKESMAKLKKLDSFMREVQRLRGNITSFIRKVVRPITLSDGTQLPPGTKILAPQAGISRDERYFNNPEELDALRFYHMRQESEEASNRWQFTSLSDTNINFGAGRHACPGRFFAGNEIKTVLAYFLINYDLRLKPGTERPMPMAMVMTKAPSPNTEVEFRRRSQAI
ncbi:hypothetical protein NLU13_1613 [Sarocladium strictum]|uniref:Cytochrome P450 n=1 Tax=Sarocladium strictum TaxID=5046 RepID=A0AA39GRB1_SARSR|nr:hypothetical protein NLU13_1613 [Sarocladium strictum]